MKFTKLGRAAVVAAAGALLLSSCAANEPAPGDAAGGASAPASTLSGDLAGAGASSMGAAQTAWIAGFQTANPDVNITYDPAGSGAGREQFMAGGVAFAGSDAYLKDEELAGEFAACAADTLPVDLPIYISPIAIIFNVEGVDELNLAPETLAGIFAGTITKWNDDAIVADNPDATLPDETITPVHRSDESGTSENFTDYLDAVAGDVWTYGAIETWPTEAGGEGGKSTSGVVQVVTDAPNTIGYADASQAGGLGQANIKVGEEYVAPSPEAAAKILEVSPAVDEGSDVNMAFDLDHETSEAGVDPIVLTSYILSDEGQEIGSAEAGSAPLTDAIREKAQAIVDQISAG